MFDVSVLDNTYDVYTNLMAEVISIEVDCMNNAEEIESVDIKIISLDMLKITGCAITDKIFMEFIFYNGQLDEIVPEHKELYIDFIGQNGVYHDLIQYYDIIDSKTKEIYDLINRYGNHLMFAGWARNNSIIESRDAGFITGFKDG